MRHQPGDDIRVFLAVCEAGNFVSASTRLRLTSSAVAKAIARLEDRLGTRLFQRTTRRVSLTEEGRIYRDVCSRARLDIERAEATISGLAREPAGKLHVTLPPLFGAEVVAPALYELCRQYPGLELEISTSTEAVDLPGEGVDLAVRIGELPDVTGLMARRLGTQDIVLCGSSTYFEERKRPVDPRDLSGHEIIGAPGNGRPAPWQFRHPDGKLVSWEPKARLLLDGSLLALSAIRGGHGLGLLPRWLVQDDLDTGLLVSVLDDQIAGHRPVHVIWTASAVMLPRLRVAIDAIVRVSRPLLLASKHD
jgi:DNA-binding transcriptional LysR family regulator